MSAPKWRPAVDPGCPRCKSRGTVEWASQNDGYAASGNRYQGFPVTDVAGLSCDGSGEIVLNAECPNCESKIAAYAYLHRWVWTGFRLFQYTREGGFWVNAGET